MKETRKSLIKSPAKHQACGPAQRQPRFHRYWQDIVKLQAQQAKKETEHGDIYRRFQAEIEPLERQQ